MATSTRSALLSFDEFYKLVFIPEHQHPMNVNLHVAGVLASFALLGLVATKKINKYYLLAYPVVVAAPGLFGHYLFERNDAVGNARFLRQDFPSLWFLWGNFRLTFDYFFSPTNLLTNKPR